MIQSRLKTVDRKTTVSRTAVKAAWAKVLGAVEESKTTRPAAKPPKKLPHSKQG